MKFEPGKSPGDQGVKYVLENAGPGFVGTIKSGLDLTKWLAQTATTLMIAPAFWLNATHDQLDNITPSNILEFQFFRVIAPAIPMAIISVGINHDHMGFLDFPLAIFTTFAVAGAIDLLATMGIKITEEMRGVKR